MKTAVGDLTIIYGLKEKNDETSEWLEQTVNKDIIEDTLGLEKVAIERIHRLGKRATDKTRPVIMKLLDYRQKVAILSRGFKLKTTDYSIGEDFSKRIRDIRKKLWDSAKPNRERKEKVSLSFDKLYINKRAYIWDEEKKDKVPMQKNDAETNRRITRRAAQAAQAAQSKD